MDQHQARACGDTFSLSSSTVQVVSMLMGISASPRNPQTRFRFTVVAHPAPAQVIIIAMRWKLSWLNTLVIGPYDPHMNDNSSSQHPRLEDSEPEPTRNWFWNGKSFSWFVNESSSLLALNWPVFILNICSIFIHWDFQAHFWATDHQNAPGPSSTESPLEVCTGLIFRFTAIESNKSTTLCQNDVSRIEPQKAARGVVRNVPAWQSEGRFSDVWFSSVCLSHPRIIWFNLVQTWFPTSNHHWLPLSGSTSMGGFNLRWLVESIHNCFQNHHVSLGSLGPSQICHRKPGFFAINLRFPPVTCKWWKSIRTHEDTRSQEKPHHKAAQSSLTTQYVSIVIHKRLSPPKLSKIVGFLGWNANHPVDHLY